jgi:hypothetical protein
VTEERPLFVLTAMALGWRDVELPERFMVNGRDLGVGVWQGTPPFLNEKPVRAWFVPRYDLEWLSTGPEIVRLGISIAPDQTLPETWGAWVGDFAPLSARAADPLTAVCGLIVAMKAAGRATEKG